MTSYDKKKSKLTTFLNNYEINRKYATVHYLLGLMMWYTVLN